MDAVDRFWRAARARALRLVAGYERRTLTEWLWLSGLLMVLVLLGAMFHWTERADQAVYDFAVDAEMRAPDNDIVIVAIDDASLAAAGRWPWRRTVLAGLIDRIADDQPRAIGVDVILSEPDRQHPEDDRALARSMARAGNVVLPALTDSSATGPVLRKPVSAMAETIGHINISTDIDGVVRQVYLQADAPGYRLDHFAASMLMLAQPDLPGGRGVSGFRHDGGSDHVGSDGWMRRFRVRIPFVGPPGSFRQVSVADVLAGRVPPAFFRGKLVLVGATASGLGDVFPVPVSRYGSGMAGVEIIANVMQTLRHDGAIVNVGAGWFWLGTVLPVVLACVAALMLTPRSALLFTVLLALAVLGISVLLVMIGHRWFAPISAVLGCLLFYPLWSWRRQEAALHFLSAELARLEQEPGLLSVVALARSGRQHLDDRMRAVYRMSSRLRDLRRFLADGIEGLPDATVICDLDGRVLLANGSCIKLAQSAGDLRNGMSPTWHVRALISAVALRPEPGLAYWESLRRAFVGKPVAAAEHPAAGVELQARNQRSMLLRGAPLRSDTGGLAGLIISLTDITQVRMAERRREETLRFLSHDMRSPQASILALIDLQAEPSHAMPLPALLSRISEHASRTLDLADEFIQLARAEAYSLKSVDLDLAGVVLDATDELWALATKRRTTVNVEVDEDHPTVSGDPVLLTRAVANLVGNAIKYGPPAGVVTVRVARRGGRIAIDVSDQGPGIDATDQLALFHPFVRLQDGKPDAPKGSGLGLVFVKTVVERHGGEMLVRSKPGAGSTFTILLPENARAAS